MKSVKIGNKEIKPDWRLMSNICKYSKAGLFHTKCSAYKTEICEHCRYNIYIDSDWNTKPEKKPKEKNYYHSIAPIG